MTANQPLFNIDPVECEPPATQVARKLGDDIVADAFRPGDRMPSARRLAESFGVGRPAMREALTSLSLSGLVEIRQGDGAYLRHTDATLPPPVIEWGLLMRERRTMDLVEARRCIESDIAEVAASRRTDADLAELAQAFERMEDAAVQDGFVNAEIAFYLQTRPRHAQFGVARHPRQHPEPAARLDRPHVSLRRQHDAVVRRACADFRRRPGWRSGGGVNDDARPNSRSRLPAATDARDRGAAPRRLDVAGREQSEQARDCEGADSGSEVSRNSSPI